MKFNKKYIEDIKTARGKYPPCRANFALWCGGVTLAKNLKDCLKGDIARGASLQIPLSNTIMY